MTREVPQIEPLACEVGHEALRLRVGQHSTDLTFERGRLPQPALRGHFEQFIVGDAAPEEEREARRQLEIAENEDAPRCKLVGFALGTEDELRTGQYALQRHLNATLEVALLTASSEEPHPPLDVGICPLSPIGPTHEGRDDLPGASFLCTRGRFAGEDPASTRHVAGTTRLEGAGDREGREVRNPQGISRVMRAPNRSRRPYGVDGVALLDPGGRDLV